MLEIAGIRSATGVRLGWLREPLVILTLAGVALWIMYPTLGPGLYPWGSDTMGHLFKVWYMAQYWAQQHALAHWMPQWYMGFELLHYYPPLVYYVLFGIYLVVRDLFQAYHLWVFAALLAAAYLTYRGTRRWLGRWPALCAGALFVLAPYNVRTLFDEGNMPRTLSLVLLPLLFHLTIRLTEQGANRRHWAALALVVGLSILAHPMQAEMFVLCLLLFAILRMALDKETRFMHLVSVATAMPLGLGLAAWWALPAYGHVELAQVPALAGEKVGFFSADWRILTPQTLQANIANIYVGLSLLVLATVAVAWKRAPWRTALYSTALCAILLAMGTHTVFFQLLPMKDSFLPERFLNFASFALAVVAASALEIPRQPGRLTHAAIAATLVLTWTDLSQVRPLVHGMEPPIDYLAISQDLRSHPGDGRVANQVSGGSAFSYLASTEGQREQTYGWAVEATPQQPKVGLAYFAIRERLSGYVAHQYGLWNVRYVILDDREEYSDSLADMLRQAGFTVLSRHGSFTLLHSDQPSAYFQQIEGQAIAIGRYAGTVSLRFPWVVEGTGAFIDEYPSEYLRLFRSLVLTGSAYRNRDEAERRLVDYVSAGGTVIADLQGMRGEWWETSPSLFGVQAVPIDLQGKARLTAPGEIPQLRGIDLDLAPFSWEGAQWQTVGYWGLDQVWLNVELANGSYPVLGYKEVGGRRIYFVGLNLFYHALVNDDPATTALCQRILDLGQPSHALTNPPFVPHWVNRQGENLTFAYDNSKAASVLVSMTYTPHWKVTLDGRPLALYPHEQLCLLNLPAGQHVVRFSYGSTPVHAVANSLSAVSALLTAACLLPIKSRQKGIERPRTTHPRPTYRPSPIASNASDRVGCPSVPPAQRVLSAPHAQASLSDLSSDHPRR